MKDYVTSRNHSKLNKKSAHANYLKIIAKADFSVEERPERAYKPDSVTPLRAGDHFSGSRIAAGL